MLPSDTIHDTAKYLLHSQCPGATRGSVSVISHGRAISPNPVRYSNYVNHLVLVFFNCSFERADRGAFCFRKKKDV